MKHAWESMCKETSVVAQTCEVNIPACLGALRKTSKYLSRDLKAISPEYETLNRNFRCGTNRIIFSYTCADMTAVPHGVSERDKFISISFRTESNN